MNKIQPQGAISSSLIEEPIVYTTSITSTTTMRPKTLYYYKGNPYSILYNSKIKRNGEWIDVVVYECEYPNPDGMIWVRETHEFLNLFKERQ